MRLFPKLRVRSLLAFVTAGLAILAAGWIVTARGALPVWIRNVEAKTEAEAAFFRSMPLPGSDVLFRRPPSETRPALTALIAKQPKDADLYSLRALEDEQQLDFPAAEADWKSYAAHSSDPVGAQIALANFYHRRLRPPEEISALSIVARAPADPSEKLMPSAEQRSWKAFERIFGVIREQGLTKEISSAQYRDWLARYPHEASLYGNFLEFLITQKDYAAATELIAQYRRQFPNDEVFPIKAQALVEYRQGSLQQGLAVYERSFQPLWSPELVKSYFDLLAQTHSLRKFLDDARAAQSARPEDLNATARVFYYYQQQGKLDAARAAIAEFRSHKERSKSAWTGSDLFVCARLLEDIHAYPEAARYYFALYNSQGMNDAQQRALEGLSDVLFTAPETPIRLGSGELSMYRDIATTGSRAGLPERCFVAAPKHRGCFRGIPTGGAARCAVLPPLAGRATSGASRFTVSSLSSAPRVACEAAGLLRIVGRERCSGQGRSGIPGGFSGCAAADRRRSIDGGCVRDEREERRTSLPSTILFCRS